MYFQIISEIKEVVFLGKHLVMCFLSKIGNPTDKISRVILYENLLILVCLVFKAIKDEIILLMR